MKISTRQHSYPVRGKLIVIEGPDNVGKTTIAKDLSNIMVDAKCQAAYYSFPGHEKRTLGQLVYNIHHNIDEYVDALNPLSLQMLHVAAHIDCVDRVIKPALKNGWNVILDRYWWSTKVYGQLNRIDDKILDALINVEKLYCGIVPDLVILIDRDVDTSEHRNLRMLYMNLMNYEALVTTCIVVDNTGSYKNSLLSILDHVSHILGRGPIPLPDNYTDL